MGEFSLETNLFLPNNHSKYEVGWKDIPTSLKREVGGIVSTYYLPGKVNVKGIREVDEWERQSNNFRISVADPEGTRLVLLHKQIKPRVYEDLVTVEDLLSHLHSQGISVPRSYTTREGSRVLAHPDGFMYRLFDFIDGDHFRGTEEELADFAGNLARLHIILANDQTFFDRISKLPGRQTVQSPVHWSGLFKTLAVEDRQGKIDEIDAIVNENRGFIMDSSNRTKQELGGGIDVRRQIVRGDLHPLDTIYTEGKLKAFIDFDDVRIGELARDVANACHRFVRQFIVYQGGDWKETLPVGVRIFMQTYQSVNPLTLEEVEISKFLIMDEILNKLFSDIGRYANGNPSYVIDGEFEKKLTLLREAVLVGEEIQR